MRPALATIAAIAAFGPPLGAAVAGDGTTEHFFTIELSDARAGVAARRETIEVESFSWGAPLAGGHDLGSWAKADGLDVTPSRTSKIDSFTIKQKTVERGSGANQMSMDDTAGREKLQPGGGGGAGQKEATHRGAAEQGGSKLDRPTFGEKFMGQLSKQDGGAGTGAAGANETVTIGANRTETASGLPTGKRQHKPMTITKEWDARSAPLPQGSLRVKVKMPWLACEEGTFYPQLVLGDPVKTYTLSDVVVTGCSAGQVQFGYAKVAFERTKPH